MEAETEAEFIELATARGAALFRTALLFAGDWHAAEDLVQETLGKLYVHWSKVRGPTTGPRTPDPPSATPSSATAGGAAANAPAPTRTRVR